MTGPLVRTFVVPSPQLDHCTTLLLKMKAGSLVISDPYSRCCPNSLSCCPADQRRQTKDWWSKLTVAATVESHFASIYYTAVTVAGVMCESEGEDKARDHLWGAPTTRNVLFSVICLLRLSLLLIMWLVCVCVFIRAMQQGHVRRDTSSTSKLCLRQRHWSVSQPLYKGWAHRGRCTWSCVLW